MERCLLKVLGTLITRENQSYMITLFLIALVAGIFAMFTFIKLRSDSMSNL